MSVIANTTTVDQAFFQPLKGLPAKSLTSKPGPEFSDDAHLRLGVQRVLESSESGRAFLQEHGARFANTPELGNYFAALRSARRCKVPRDVNVALIGAAHPALHDRLADIPELDNYECFAGDGHWHQAAAHDPRHEDSKMAVGHFYALNLRRHTLQHLTAGQGLHEHDRSALKRVKPKGLRQAVPKGKRVLIVYDKAGIDFAYWRRCRQECAVYFLSRVKENMVFDWLESLTVDTADPRNHGVSQDWRVSSRDGHPLRIILYTDPQSGENYEFLTNEPDLPPAVIVELYRRRWEAEKTFDQIKNKLCEKKAWATSLVAKEAQALFIAITHNLLLLYLELSVGAVAVFVTASSHTILKPTLKTRCHGGYARRKLEVARLGRSYHEPPRATRSSDSTANELRPS
jgi:hypothetical protein